MLQFKIEIIVEGTKVEPVDPLFLTPGIRYYLPENRTVTT